MWLASERSSLESYLRDEAGTAAILWAVSLVAVFGLVSLSFDIGRMSSTHAELQAFVDQVALAAAGELDGASDAITRADAAAANLITDTQSFGNLGAALGSADIDVTYYRAIPALDTDPLDSADITTNPNKAVFVHVAIKPARERDVRLIFASAVSQLTGAGPTIATLGAEAVAGFTMSACDLTPVMFCLPQEDDGFGNMVSYVPAVGEQLLLRSGGGSGAWGPGDFGWLDPQVYEDLGGTCSGLNGGNLLTCLVGAIQNKTSCVNTHGVDTETGQKVGLEDAAFNTRFDIYASSLNGEKNNPDYAPAPVVISGYTQNCKPNKTASTNTRRMPRDGCFAAGTCNRAGDGDFLAGLKTYLDINYGNADGIYVAGEGQTQTGVADANIYTGTRWDIYENEVAYAQSNPAPSTLVSSGLDETGLPSCAKPLPAATDAARRVIVAAAVDCASNPVSGKETGVPVADYLEVFITEPVGDDGLSPPTLDMYAEVIGSAGGNGYGGAGPGGIFRDLVQLYR